MPTKTHVITAIAIIALLGIASVTTAPAETMSVSYPATTTSASIIESDSYTIPVTKKESVVEAMNEYAATGAFMYTAHEYPSLGLFVDSIGGKKNTGGYYWILYVNGRSSDVGASGAIVTPGDVVEWRYEKSY